MPETESLGIAETTLIVGDQVNTQFGQIAAGSLESVSVIIQAVGCEYDPGTVLFALPARQGQPVAVVHSRVFIVQRRGHLPVSPRVHIGFSARATYPCHNGQECGGQGITQ